MTDSFPETVKRPDRTWRPLRCARSQRRRRARVRGGHRAEPCPPARHKPGPTRWTARRRSASAAVSPRQHFFGIRIPRRSRRVGSQVPRPSSARLDPLSRAPLFCAEKVCLRPPFKNPTRQSRSSGDAEPFRARSPPLRVAHPCAASPRARSRSPPPSPHAPIDPPLQTLQHGRSPPSPLPKAASPPAIRHNGKAASHSQNNWSH